MKYILKIEELFQFGLTLFLVHYFEFSWLWFIAWFLSPDLSMLGYLFNTQIGATLYNIAHHKGLAIALFMLGYYWNIAGLEFAGLLLFSHISFDRALGYGLKYSDNFRHTHLGFLGKSTK